MTGDLTHELCRTHAFCARGSQYHGAICSVCDDLWQTAKDLDNPDDAVIAWEGLKEWIRGFRKNSRHRTNGEDHFYDKDERIMFEETHALHANLKIITVLDAAASSSKQSSLVSTIYPFVLILSLV